MERDVRQIKNIGDLKTFQTFLRLCVGRTGQVINFSSLALDCGISHTTAREWMTILEASYLVFFLQPFYKNFNKRLVKMPKLYFYDTGLACNLLGIENERQLETHYLKEGLYENLAILELLKGRLNKALPAHLYFWRNVTGHEIDCVAEWGGVTRAIEIKAAVTVHPEFIKNLQYFESLSPDIRGYLVYNGTSERSFVGQKLVPINKLHQILED